MSAEAAEIKRILGLKEDQLDSRGDRSSGSGFTCYRGGLKYTIPGPQWKCIGLNVSGKYDRKNSDWLKKDGNKREWAIGYRPFFKYSTAATRFDSLAARENLSKDTNVNHLSRAKICGDGLIFTDNIEFARKLAAKVINSKEPLLIYKARLDPKRVTIPMNNPEYRIVSSKEDCREYGICVLNRSLKEPERDDSVVWDSIGNNVYRDPPTEIEYETSRNIESRLINSSPNVKQGLPILKTACEDIGAELIFTEKKGESDLELLPTLLQKGKLQPKISFIMKSNENYDDLFGSVTDIINSPYVKRLKYEIAASANVEISEIEIRNVQRGSVIVTAVVEKDSNIKAVEKNLPHFKISGDVRELKAILKLSEDDFDSEGDNYGFTGIDGGGGIRGGMTYKQPGPEWKRIGLRVRGRYDNGNDDWLEMGGKPGEWAIGFHGPGSLDAARSIAGQRSIKGGVRQACEYETDINPLSDNKGKKCGDGSYFAENIETARGYAQWGTIEEESRMLVFQARLNPRKVRVPEGYPDYRIVPTPEDSRIYGMCILSEISDSESSGNVIPESSHGNVIPEKESSQSDYTFPTMDFAEREREVRPKNDCMCDNCRK